MDLERDRKVLTDLYRQLRNESNLSTSEICARSGLNPASLHEAMALLTELGLLTGSGRGSGPPTVTSTETALIRLTQQAEQTAVRWLEETIRVRKAMRLLTTELADQYQQQESLAPAELIVGLDHISEVLEDCTELAQDEVLSMHPGPVVKSRSKARLKRNQKVVNRSVGMRTIHLASTARLPEGLALLEEMQESGVQIRLAPTIPFRLIVIDDVMAFTPAFGDAEAQPTAMITRGPVITRLLRRVFEHCWQSAVELGTDTPPPQTPVDTPLTGQQASILRLMNAGNKDEAIARELGVSTRTLRRLMNDLMEKLGADNRFRAGVRAQQLGWLK